MFTPSVHSPRFPCPVSQDRRHDRTRVYDDPRYGSSHQFLSRLDSTTRSSEVSREGDVLQQRRQAYLYLLDLWHSDWNHGSHAVCHPDDHLHFCPSFDSTKSLLLLLVSSQSLHPSLHLVSLSWTG